MREYIVRPGDSPANISTRFAGCPKCARDLIASNAHKEAVVHPNSFVTFKELRVGEKLVLPEKWFTKEFDELPPAYFAALPHPDGVTPSKLGVGVAAGVLGDYTALDVASAKVSALSAMPDQQFSAAVNDTAAAIDTSVREVDEGIGAAALRAGPYAQDARRRTNEARQRNTRLTAAITAGDQPTAFQVRRDILSDFSAALASARLALQTFYGSGSQQPPAAATVVDAARAAAAAIAADPSYCTSVAQPSSAVNSAVHAFKTAWNASNPGAPVPIGTGTYEQATADAIKSTLGTSPAACAPRATPSSFQPGTLTPPQEESGLSTSAIVGLGLLGVGAVGGAIYLATRDLPAPTRARRQPSPPTRRPPLVRRVRPRPTYPPMRPIRPSFRGPT